LVVSSVYTDLFEVALRFGAGGKCVGASGKFIRSARLSLKQALDLVADLHARRILRPRLRLTRASGGIPEHWPSQANDFRAVWRIFMSRYLRGVNVVKATVVVALVGLAVSGCGSGRHVTFSTVFEACGLSVPMPQGFHRVFWNNDGDRAVTIYDGTAGYGNPIQWPADSNRVLLAVYDVLATPGRDMPHEFRFPAKLGDLERGSGGITSWSGGGLVGTGNSKRDCGVALWLGSNDSGAHRAAILSALQAIKPN
jgi:hypothetical protein